MAKPPFIELGDPKDPLRIPILFEDRSVVVIDKPAGWLLVPSEWRQTGRNLQAAIESSIAGGDYWARSRNLRFLRYVHRLDAETSGALLLVKNANAMGAYSALFESRDVEKCYLAVVPGVPRDQEWTCLRKLGPDPLSTGRGQVDDRAGKEAETRFRVLTSRLDPGLGEISLIEARPLTGRTHQIRIHLSVCGHAVLGDQLYSAPGAKHAPRLPAGIPMALRAVALAYPDPFTGRRVHVAAPREAFGRAFGFAPKAREEGREKESRNPKADSRGRSEVPNPKPEVRRQPEVRNPANRSPRRIG
jgi:RluA family pseudouridine synthase